MTHDTSSDNQSPTTADGVGITVAIPTVRPTTVTATIESVLAQTHDNWELIVVMQGDDESLARAVDDATAGDDRARGMWIPTKGLNRARNAAIRAARHDVIAFVDDDCEAAPTWLAEIVSAFADDPDVGVVAGTLVAPPAKRWPISVCPAVRPEDFVHRSEAGDADLPPGADFAGANLVVTRDAWERVGYFDDELGPGSTFRGGCDIDFVLRALRVGVAVRFLPTAVVTHTSGRRYGVRSVLQLSTDYGRGQGAVAGKMSLESTADAGSWNGAAWREGMWRQTFIEPFTRLRPQRFLRSLPRLLGFEREYRRCRREYELDERGNLRASAGAS